jgi:hypothetical protein
MISNRFKTLAVLAIGTAPIVVASSPLLVGNALAGAPSASPPKKGAPSGPGCLYGQVVDGHTGEIRCLSPAEVAPPGPYDTPAERGDAGADAAIVPDAASFPRRDAAADSSAPIPLKSFGVAIEGVSFENGDVPRVPAALERIKKDFLKCGTESTTVKPDATIELRFLVRAPGRAEGVDVVQSRGMSSDVVRCVVSALSGRPVGAPTNDPVGVTFTIRFRKD